LNNNNKNLSEKINLIYGILFNTLGPQYWWPGETAFEVCVGAILTQNTNWQNVKKAIDNLKNNGLLAPKSLYMMDISMLSEFIRSSGYYNIKSRRLKAFLSLLCEEFSCDIDFMFTLESECLRKKLLEVNGIGHETADSIMLYAGNHLQFVVDAYTYRILLRHNIIQENAGYDDIKELFQKSLPPEIHIYNEYHALIVNIGKNYCKKTNPICDKCPLKNI
jgi:endonuclease-3 related protein